MFSRTSKLIHPASGISLETPLLIPSFSSKGFGFGREGKSEITQVIEASKEFITKTCLVSAYDVHYQYIPEPQDLLINVDLMFLDSGGYEVSNDRDLSAIGKPIHRPREWSLEKLEDIWDQWPCDIPAVFVSYDHPNQRKSVLEQIRDAEQSLLTRSKHLHSFLLKPQTKDECFLDSALRELSLQISELAGFQLIGVTEKELGNSILERMINLAMLRQTLDNFALSIPIHVFGALDPLSVCLYFVSGAEVFDGLSWSRYAYNSGQCIYVHNNAAIAYGIDVVDDEVYIRTIKDNLNYLDQLERSLRLFSKTGDWSLMAENCNIVRGAVERLRSELERRH